MLTVVLFLWRTDAGVAFRKYTADHVNAVVAMLAKHLHVPHRVVLVTDNGVGVRSSVTRIAIEHRLMIGVRYPKLMLFRPDAKELFGGSRLLMIDLDVVILDDIASLVNRSEDFIIWRDPLADREGYETSHRYNSSLILMNAGCRPHVYMDFDPAGSPDVVRNGRLCGSDQAWIGMQLGPHEATFTQDDGVLGWKHDLDRGRTWPAGTKMIFNHGRPKAWELEEGHPLRFEYERYDERVAA